VLREQDYEVTGLDLLASPGTDVVGSVTERALVRDCLAGVSAVLHAATLHKPHVGSHGMQEFVDTNVTGTHAPPPSRTISARPSQIRLRRTAVSRQDRHAEPLLPTGSPGDLRAGLSVHKPMDDVCKTAIHLCAGGGNAGDSGDRPRP